ncbi:MAG TPA: SRPBCC family protein [Burkholderiales bacterium]|nr:SRPBCC family protein [Burkholderiales bacterium]
MLKWSLAAFAAIVVVFLIVVAMQPSDFRIERSATMRAPAPAAFAQVNDFQNWRAWSPWEKVDPALKRQYDGPRAGTGAVYAWQGNKDVGEGRMTITDSKPAELVRIKLEFFKPFAATNQAEFRFKPASTDTTAVTWTMTGQNNFLSKAICLFVDMDKMVGGMFEQGLNQMKTVVERSS